MRREGDETGFGLYLRRECDLLGPAKGRVDEEDGPAGNQTATQLYYSDMRGDLRHLNVEQYRSRHDDEAIGVALMQLLKRQKHEINEAENYTKDKEGGDDRAAPASGAFVVFDIEVRAAFGAKPTFVARGTRKCRGLLGWRT